MPSIREILKAQIASLGGDGLCFPFTECGCGLDEIAPCGCLDIDGCKVAKKEKDGLYYVMKESCEHEWQAGLEERGYQVCLKCDQCRSI